MTLLIWVIIFIVLIIVSYIFAMKTDSDKWIMTLVTLATVTAVMSLVLVGGTIGERIMDGQCNKFAEVSGYEVQFIKYNTVSFECLVKTSDGWIPKNQIRAVEDL